MDKSIEAMKLALEALQFALHVGFDESSESQIKKGDTAGQQHRKAITALEEALAEHAMQEVQRLGQEIEPDDIASILACRDMLDAQPVPPRTWVGSGDIENSNAYLTPPQRKPLTNGEIYTAYITATNQTLRATDERLAFAFARAIEAKIKENT
jgi:hypothetical protein